MCVNPAPEQNRVNQLSAEQLDLEDRARPARLEDMRERVEAYFAGDKLADLRAKIMHSLDVPQLGQYHCEGMYMDTHIARILYAIDEVSEGRLASQIPHSIRNAMIDLASERRFHVERYALLHDLEKASCLTIKYLDGRSEEKDLKSFLATMPEASRGVPSKTYEFCKSSGIESISYYHKSTERLHGPEAEIKLRREPALQGVLPDELLTAIGKHEVAYQFSRISAQALEKHFGGITQEGKIWVLLANYIDLMGSLQPNQEPDMAPFFALAHSLNNANQVEYCRNLLGRDPDIDQKELQKKLQGLMQQDKPIVGTREDLSGRLALECKIKRYSREKMLTVLNVLVADSTLTEDQRNQVLAALLPDGRLNPEGLAPVRAQLGAKNRILAASIEQARI